MRRLAGLALLVVLAGCTPDQREAWLEWFHLDPQAAIVFAGDGCGDLGCSVDAAPSPDSATSSDGDSGEDHADGIADTPCAQWASTALAAGWTVEQWNEPVARIMWAESRCNPNAYNGITGVAGLMQIHPLWRADAECAGNLYDPYTNLVCARHVYAVQGFGAWVTY